MKIVFLMHSFYEINVGGAEYQAYTISKKLIKHDHKINFVFLKSENEACNNSNSFNLFPIDRIRYKKLTPLKLIYCFKVLQLLKEIKPDIIYHRNFSSFLLMAHIYKLFNKKVKIIFHISHDNDTPKYKLNLRPSKILKSIDDLFRYFALYFTKNIISQTKFQQQKLLKNHKKHSSVIMNFSEPSKNIGYAVKENLIVWIANVKEKKNPLDFIRLANDLKNTDYRFVMMGKPPGGKFQKKFDATLKDSNVTYLGQVKNVTVNEILCKSKILCCTSFGEGFSNTFIQAWTRKVPVVSQYVDPDGLIEENGLGYCSQSYEALKDNVLTLIENPEILETMAKKVKYFSDDNFLIDNNFHKFIKFMEKR